MKLLARKRLKACMVSGSETVHCQIHLLPTDFGRGVPKIWIDAVISCKNVRFVHNNCDGSNKLQVQDLKLMWRIVNQF